MKNRFLQLDILRTIALLLVIFYHYYINISAIPFWNDIVYNGGQTGVMIFYVLSGFLISFPFIKKRMENKKLPSMQDYIINRVLRIVPLFWFVTIVLFIFKDHIALYQIASNKPTVQDLFLYLLFLSNKWDILNPVIWTLRVEVLFYILFPILFLTTYKFHRFLFKYKWILAFVFFLLFMAHRFFIVSLLNDTHEDILVNTISNLEGFFIGIFLAVLFVSKSWPSFLKQKLFFLIPIIALVALCKINESVDKVSFFPFFRSGINVGIFLLFATLLGKDFSNTKQVVIKVFSFVSKISFSLYIIHFNIYYNVVLPFLKNFLKSSSVNILLWATCSLMVTFIVSTITYYLIEKPFLSITKKLVVIKNA